MTWQDLKRRTDFVRGRWENYREDGDTYSCMRADIVKIEWCGNLPAIHLRNVEVYSESPTPCWLPSAESMDPDMPYIDPDSAKPLNPNPLRIGIKDDQGKDAECIQYNNYADGVSRIYARGLKATDGPLTWIARPAQTA